MQKLFQAFAVVCTVAVAKERLRAEGEPDQNQHGDHVDFKGNAKSGNFIRTVR